MKKISIGTCSLGRIPRIVAIVDHPISTAQVRRIVEKGADILEIRADLFRCAFEKTLAFVREIRKHNRIPLIATIRETKSTSGKRDGMFRQMLPFVDAVDIEIDASDSHEIIALAQKKTIIVSEHDFSGTPSDVRLDAIVTKANRLGGDIVKIAAMAKSRDDVKRLMCFAAGHKQNLVAISMGKYGSISRVAAPLFGSLFTYAFVSSSVAPGQISLVDTARFFRRFYPSA